MNICRDSFFHPGKKLVIYIIGIYGKLKTGNETVFVLYDNKLEVFTSLLELQLVKVLLSIVITLKITLQMNDTLKLLRQF